MPTTGCIGHHFPLNLTQDLVSRYTSVQAGPVLLQGSNAELRDRLHEVTGQLQTAQAEAGALQRLQDSAQDAAGPSVDALIQAAVASERAAQDTRNRKVLELLNNKVGSWLCRLLLILAIADCVECTQSSVACCSHGIFCRCVIFVYKVCVGFKCGH